MTVLNVSRKGGPFVAMGTTFEFHFKVFTEDDVYVVVNREEEETRLDPSEYTVTLNPNQDLNAGGTIELINPINDDTATVTIGSQVEYTQESVMTNRGGFYPATLNDIHDKLTILIQQLLDDVQRCLKVALSSPQTPEEYLNELIKKFEDEDEDIRGLAQSAINIATQALSSSVMGPAGPAGIQGPQGIQGEVGPQGPRGEAPRVDTIDCGHAPENQLIFIDGGNADTVFTYGGEDANS